MVNYMHEKKRKPELPLSLSERNITKTIQIAPIKSGFFHFHVSCIEQCAQHEKENTRQKKATIMKTNSSRQGMTEENTKRGHEIIGTTQTTQNHSRLDKNT